MEWAFLALLGYAMWLTALVGSYNRHARLLGREVEVRFYEASDWERCVCVAVSHHGAYCVRRVSDPLMRARWIPKSKAPTHVRRVRSW